MLTLEENENNYCNYSICVSIKQKALSALQLIKENEEEAYRLANHAYEKSKREKVKCWLPDITMILGKVAYDRGNFKESIEFFGKGLDSCKEYHGVEKICRLKYYMSTCLVELGQYNRALKELQETQLLMKTDNSNPIVGDIYNELAHIYCLINEVEKAETYLIKAKNIWAESGDKEKEFIVTTNLGYIASNQKQNKKAINFAENALQTAKECDSLREIALAYNNLASMLEKSGRNSDAVETFILALDILENVENAELKAKVLYNLSVCYSKLNKKDKSEYYINQSMIICEKHSFNNLLTNVYEKIEKLYSESGDFENAYRISIKLRQINEFLLKEKIKSKITLEKQNSINKCKDSYNKYLESEKKFQLIAENTSDGILITDEKGKVTYASPAYLKMTGYSIEEEMNISPKTIYNRIHPEDRNPIFRSIYKAIKQKRSSLIYGFRAKHKNGEYYWREDHAKFQYSKTNELLRTYIICRNIEERISQEKKLRKFIDDISLLRSRQQDMEDNMLEWIWEIDKEGKYVYSSKSSKEILGYTSDEILGKSPIDFLIDSEKGRIEKILCNTFANKAKINNLVNWNLKKSGKKICLLTNAIPVFKSSGEFKGYRGFDSDITIQKLAEEKLLKLNRRMKIAADSAQIGIWDLDLVNNILVWDEWMYRLYGLNPNDFGGAFEAWQSALHPDDFEKANKQVQEAIEKKQIFDSDFRIVRPDGEIRYLKAHAIVNYDNQGKPLHMIGTNHDITKRKLAENDLKKSEEKFRIAFLTMPDGVTLSRLKDGIFIDVNKSMLEKTGFSKEDVIGKSGIELSLWKNKKHRAEFADLLLKSGVVDNYKTTFAAPNGEYEVLMSARIIEMNNEDVVVTIAKDISTETSLQKQLLHAQKLESIGYLAGGIAHDFNNMLGIILGYSVLLKNEIGENSSIIEMINEIEEATRKSADLTRQLLLFARKKKLSPVELDINSELIKMKKLLSRLIGENIDIKLETSPDSLNIKIDPSQLDQIIANLCINARDAIDGIGKIIIKTGKATINDIQGYSGRNHDEFVRIDVSDTGCGIEPSLLTKIFEPLFTTKPEGMGTGLGLSTVCGIVNQNDGYIEVKSEVNEGTVFTIFLPTHINNEKSTEYSKQSINELSGNETILIIEDDQSILKMLQRSLLSFGYNILPFSSPVKALEYIMTNNSKLDIVISDVVMPEMSGIELMNKIRDKLPKIPYLFMSGYTNTKIDTLKGFRRTINFIQKPFEISVMINKIKEILR